MTFMKKLVVQIALVFGCVYAHGQQSFNNTGNLRIHNGANVSAFGTFTNTSSGAFVNNGTLYIRGSITNNQASMANSSGSLHLNGSSAQIISGTQTFRTNNLITNNASGITLNNNLSVAGAHTFTSGLITTSATPNYLVYEAGSSHSGSSDNRHVNGWVTKQGTTSFTFPVGNGTYLRNIAIGSLSASSVFNARYSGPTTNTNNLDASLISVDPYEYWTLNQISGGTAQVTLNWDASKISFPQYSLGSIRVAQYNVNLWTNRGGTATGDPTTTGTITSNSISSFGAFTFGTMSATLPLQYINLTAKRNDGFTLVKWKTEQEVNVDHFEIERRDNNEFVKIGVANARNLLTPNFYEYEDHKHLNGNAYYRIKSVDIDGQTFYSNIVMVSDKEKGGSYKIVNPVVNSVYLQVDDSYRGRYRYEIIGSSGQLIQTGQINIESAGTVNIPLNNSVLKGHYILKLQSGTNHITEKIIVR
jgi:hypothetical protein